MIKGKNSKIRTILTLIVALFVCFSNLSVVKAEPARDLVIEGGTEGEGYTYESGVLTILKGGEYTISMEQGVDESSDEIVVLMSEEFEPLTLTLNNLTLNTQDIQGKYNIYVDYRPAPYVPLDLTLILQGENSFTALEENIQTQFSVMTTTIKGDGKMTFTSTGTLDTTDDNWPEFGNGAIGGDNLYIESGDIVLNDTFLVQQKDIEISGGTLTINDHEENESGAIYVNNTYKQTGGTVTINDSIIGIRATGISNKSTSDTGISVLGGDLTINASTVCFGLGMPEDPDEDEEGKRKDVIIDNDASVDLSGAFAGMYGFYDFDLTMNNGTLKISDCTYGIRGNVSDSTVNINGGETEISAATEAVSLGRFEQKSINISEDYKHKSYNGNDADDREEVADADINDDDGNSKPYLLITPAYEITYDLDGGELPEGKENPTIYTRVDEFTLFNPSKEDPKNYFTGWTGTDLEELTETVKIEEGSKGDREYKANYHVTYTVSFDVLGHGIAPEDQTLDEGEKVQKPADPTEEGFTFEGWFTDEECTKEYDFASEVEGDLTLYAKWTEVAKTYTVSFDVLGHGTAPKEQTVNAGEKVQKPEDPTEDGFTFEGWFTDEECTKEYDFSSEVEEDLTLYAKWTENEPEISYSCDTDVVHSEGEDKDETFTYKRSVDDQDTYNIFSDGGHIEVNGKVLDEADYKTASGSLVLTLKGSYLKTLAPGQYNVKAVFPDGEAEGLLIIKKAEDKKPDEKKPYLAPKTGVE